MNIKIILSIVAVAVAVAVAAVVYAESNSSVKNDKNVYRVPLIKECESFVEKRLDELLLPSFSYHIVKYDHIAKSHPSIIGSIEISSNILGKPDLSEMANSFLLDCYPRSHTSILKKDNLSQELTKSLDTINRFGVEKLYIVDDEDALTLFYKLPK